MSVKYQGHRGCNTPPELKTRPSVDGVKQQQVRLVCFHLDLLDAITAEPWPRTKFVLIRNPPLFCINLLKINRSHGTIRALLTPAASTSSLHPSTPVRWLISIIQEKYTRWRDVLCVQHTKISLSLFSGETKLKHIRRAGKKTAKSAHKQHLTRFCQENCSSWTAGWAAHLVYVEMAEKQPHQRCPIFRSCRRIHSSSAVMDSTWVSRRGPGEGFWRFGMVFPIQESLYLLLCASLFVCVPVQYFL